MTADSIRDDLVLAVRKVLHPEATRNLPLADLYSHRVADAVLALRIFQAVAHEAAEVGMLAEAERIRQAERGFESARENPYPLTGPDPLEAARAEALESAGREMMEMTGDQSEGLGAWLIGRAATIRALGIR